MKERLRFIARRLGLRVWKFLNKTHSLPVGADERYAAIIVSKLLADNGNELLLHPSLHKFYIKSELNKIFLVCSSSPNEVTIINHVYCYNVKLGERAYTNIYDRFVREVEKRRQSMEDEYTSNIQFSLMGVANNIKSGKVKKS